MFSTDFIFRQQENLVDNQKCQAGFRPLCNKILLSTTTIQALLSCLLLTAIEGSSSMPTASISCYVQCTCTSYIVIVLDIASL